MTSPFDGGEEWGQVLLSGMPLPGIIESIDGCERAYEWKVEKGKGSGGATSTYQGEKISESIKIKMVALSPVDFDDFLALGINVSPAKEGDKPPNFFITNPIINQNRIFQVAIKSIGQLTHEGKGKWSLTVEFIEFRPSHAVKTGTSQKAKPTKDGQQKDEEPTPLDDNEKQIAELTKQGNDEAAKE